MHEIIWNIYLPCIHISVALYRGDFLCSQFMAPWGNHQAMKPGDWYCPAGLLNFLHLLQVHRKDHFKSTGKSSAVWAHRKKKQKTLHRLHWHNEQTMLPCYETSSWQIWVHGFRRWKSTNQQGAAVGISCTTILPWSCWGLWWHAVCEESALPKASFTDKDFYKRSLPPQKKPEDIASEFVSSKWHQRNKDCFQRANDQWFRYKKAKRDWCFFFEISLRFCMRKHDPLCDPRCGCDRPDESRSRSPRRCQWPRFHGFHLSGSPQEIEVHSMNSS